MCVTPPGFLFQWALFNGSGEIAASRYFSGAAVVGEGAEFGCFQCLNSCLRDSWRRRRKKATQSRAGASTCEVATRSTYSRALMLQPDCSRVTADIHAAVLLCRERERRSCWKERESLKCSLDFTFFQESSALVSGLHSLDYGRGNSGPIKTTTTLVSFFR